MAERTLAGSDGGLLHNTAPQAPLLIYLETLIKVDAFVVFCVLKCWDCSYLCFDIPSGFCRGMIYCREQMGARQSEAAYQISF